MSGAPPRWGARDEVELARARARLEVELGRILGEGPLPGLEEALTHSSLANETAVRDNQRLEFLGDAVLGLCVSELLAAEHPAADEGLLTRMRSALVNADALARWSRSADIGACIGLGRGARATGEREQTNVLADTVEALVACVYHARGLEGARLLVQEITREPMLASERLGSSDPKNVLQELVQGEGMAAPTYRVSRLVGPPHDPAFTVEVLVEGVVRGTGEGRSKRQAERAAAQDALASWDVTGS